MDTYSTMLAENDLDLARGLVTVRQHADRRKRILREVKRCPVRVQARVARETL